MIAGGAGAADFIGSERTAPEVRLELRPLVSLLTFSNAVAPLRPWAGIDVTTRGSFWGGAGVLFDIGLERFGLGPWALVPSAGLGGYAQGNGKDLGSPLEFRTGVELAYQFGDGSRLALSFSHTSNAGVARHNPGLEALVVSYQVPIGRLLGW